jgi:hypothetical protein
MLIAERDKLTRALEALGGHGEAQGETTKESSRHCFRSRREAQGLERRPAQGAGCQVEGVLGEEEESITFREKCYPKSACNNPAM